MEARSQDVELAERMRVVLRLGEAAHRYGCSTPRVEETMAQVSAVLGLTGQFFAQPTSLFASFGSLPDQHTVLVRFEPGVVNLGARWHLDATIDDLLSGRISSAQALAQLEQLERAPAPYGQALRAVAFAAASASAARFFGASWTDMAAAGLCGLLVWLLDVLAQRHSKLAHGFDMFAAAAVSACAVLLARGQPAIGTYVVTLSGLIVLLPGLTLTTAISELAQRHLVAGTARLMGAMMTFLQLGFGVAIGRLAGQAARASAVDPQAWVTSTGSLLAALVLAPASFAVLLKARSRDLGWVLFASSLAYAGTRLGAGWMGPELGAFLGALLLGMGANFYARRFHRPSATLLLPGLLILVPGSLGFRSFSALIDQDVLTGMGSAISVALVAISLVAGLFAASALVHPRSLDTPGA